MGGGKGYPLRIVAIGWLGCYPMTRLRFSDVRWKMNSHYLHLFDLVILGKTLHLNNCVYLGTFDTDISLNVR
jgi:hypothetical protein